MLDNLYRAARDSVLSERSFNIQQEVTAMPAWLKDAVFYEIYPQSFYDSNGDGIGDINGIAEKLDYVRDLGCNAVWINPCFDSPFKDAGYDVRDYKKVAPRYGTNADLIHLFEEAHRKGMHVFLDLVPGHTSEEHPWFLESKKAEHNEYSGRYIWSDHCFEGMPGHPYIAGESERSAAYMLNFFKCQPALNYGFLNPDAPWKKPMDDPDCIATKEAMKDVIRFWLDKGCDGFRVDMADSLVKEDDEKKTGTSRIWRDVRRMLDREYPEAALVSEWGNPELSLKAGFHMDFMLSGFHRPSTYLVRDYENHGNDPLSGDVEGSGSLKVVDRSYFRKDSGGSIRTFLNEYERMYANTRHDGYMCFISCNHDTPRTSWTLDDRERRLFYAFLFTMPGVPFLYYGDEIGMRYLNLPTKEGGYFRTGTRSPMQWSREKNLGFSTADAASLYLPVDPADDAPAVEDQKADADSLYHTVKDLIALRHAQPDLQADGEFEALCAEDTEPLFLYRRGLLLLAVNPSSQERSVRLPSAYTGSGRDVLFRIGSGSCDGQSVRLGAQSFLVLR